MNPQVSIIVPVHNAQATLRRCVNSILHQEFTDLELLLIDDGSTDDSGALCDEFAAQDERILVIHKENSGVSDARNLGLSRARGTYLQFVDSDDWVDQEAYAKILAKLKELSGGEDTLDMLVSNYVYEKEGAKHKKVMRCSALPKDTLFTWKDVGRFRKGQYILMHSVIYRTKLLRECGLVLPKHTFYVDNLFANQPLPYVKTLCYLDLDLYHYFLGREDQSVNEKVLMSRIDQQIRVTKMVATAADLEKLSQTQPKLARYLTRNISIMMSISCIHLLLIGTPKAKQKREALWHYIRAHNRKLYHILKYKTLCGFTYLPGGRLGDAVTIGGYRAAKRIYQFN